MLSERLATVAGSTPSGIGTSIGSAKGTRTRSLAKPPNDSLPIGSPYIESRGTDSQFPVRPARQASHSPQEIWNGTLTRSPGSTDLTRVADLGDLGDALVPEWERPLDRRGAADDSGVEIAGGERDRVDNRLAVPLELWVRGLPPLQLPLLDEVQLLHRLVLSAGPTARSAAKLGFAMDAEELRTAQGPLKERYRDDPEAAKITLEAEGRLDEGIACSVQTSQALVQAGLHPGTGGDGVAACSGDMLLQALVACAGVTMRAVAASIGTEVDGTIHAEGDLDWRGTLSVDKRAPVGFTAIRLRFELDSEADEEELATLQRLTERYCVVFQTLAGSPAVEVSLARP